jgi:hypothetical protein
LSGSIKSLLKPNKAKIMIFVILAFFVFILLPFYPVHTVRTKYDEGAIAMESSDYTSYKSVAIVYVNDYKWEDSTIIYPGPGVYKSWTTIVWEYSADSNYMVMYVPYFFITYLIGCVLALPLNRNRLPADDELNSVPPRSEPPRP